MFSLYGNSQTLLGRQATWIAAKLADSTLNGPLFVILMLSDGRHVFCACPRTGVYVTATTQTQEQASGVCQLYVS